ncbi:MAG: SRPBCC family protein [Myxococcota bacterium]|nr:SRPBCC family protein [Myxococcota bacterium]
MIHFSLSQTIRRPLAEVFDYWANPDNIPAWQSGIVSYRRTSTGPVGVGTTYAITRKAIGLKQETSGAYTAFEKDRRFAEAITAGPAKYTIETVFTAVGGTTRVDVETTIDLGRLLGRLGAKAAQRPIRKQAEQDHAKVKALIEAR